MTALQAVRDSAGVEPGDRVLVGGASGGVGSFAVTPTGTLVLIGGPQGPWVGGMPRFAAALALSRVVRQHLVPLFSSPLPIT